VQKRGLAVERIVAGADREEGRPNAKPIRNCVDQFTDRVRIRKVPIPFISLSADRLRIELFRLNDRDAMRIYQFCIDLSTLRNAVRGEALLACERLTPER
jgi:hypothetical protein